MAIGTKDLVFHRILMAKEKLRAAKLLFEKKLYRDAVSRAYYAMFSAARAMLATKRLDSRKHSGVISLFNQHFVKTSILDKEFGRILKETQELREDSDYEEMSVMEREDAAQAIREAEKVIAGVKKFLVDSKWLKNEKKNEKR